MNYLLDTNVFIEAYKRYYQNEIVPSFWEFVNKDQDIYTIEKVKEEIKAGDDDLIKNIKNIKIVNTIDSRNIMEKISNDILAKYKKEDAGRFLEGVDYLLCVFAKDQDCIIVTEEVKKQGGKISIPNVCEDFGIKCIDTFKMLKDKNINLCTYTKK